MNIQALIIVLVFLFVPKAYAAFGPQNYVYYPNGVDSIVGTILGVSANTIEFYDEQDKVKRKFIYLTDLGPFKTGDRVRLYYYPKNHVIQNLKKETSVEYRKNEQNLGFISRTSS